MNLEQKLEAILFYKNEPIPIKKLASILEIGENEAKDGLKNLSESLNGRGICLIMTDTEVSLATAPEVSNLIENLTKEELSRDIGKAGLETLAIVLYGGPISRREIDYIRGVNSTFILRNLMMRGLVERESDPKDNRVYRYKSSLSILAHLGVKTIEELPDFAILKSAVNQATEDRKD